jgi:hypothetical protein
MKKREKSKTFKKSKKTLSRLDVKPSVGILLGKRGLHSGIALLVNFSYFFAGIAQLGEQLFYTQLVKGSIPFSGIFFMSTSTNSRSLGSQLRNIGANPFVDIRPH